MAAADALPAVTAVEVLRLQPGDTLLVHIGGPPRVMMPDDAARLKASILAQLSVPVPILIAPEGVRFSVVRPES